MKTLKQFLQETAVIQALNYIERNPKENILKIVKLAKKFVKDPDQLETVKSFEQVFKNPNNPWTKLINRLFSDVNSHCQKMFYRNFFINSVIYGVPKKKAFSMENNINVPWTFIIDPTSRCNLNCTGCWASKYNKKDDMDIETLNRIIEQGKEIGIYFYIYSGGEPLVRKEDLITLAEKHNDCYFLAFTNGTLLDKKFANELSRVGNFTVAFSIEGNEEETDFRRGKGTYKKVIKSMELLKEKGVLFGISTCYHHLNYKNIGSDEFTDDMIKRGAFFEWLFTYIPLGKDAVIDLCAKPEEREYMYYRVREMRETKDLFFMDFWNDAEFVNGCIAGGRCYFHINANGDVEPCAFVHYSDVNIKNVSLKEALQCKIFKEYRKNWPFNCNHLRPCPIFDNPQEIKKMVRNSGAISTQPLDKETAEVLCEKCMPIAEKWAPVADKLWQESHPDKD